MRYEISILKTKELSADQISDINRLKDQYWPYGPKEHMRWFVENLTEDDTHLMLLENRWESYDENDDSDGEPSPKGNRLLGYLNLVKTEAIIDTKRYDIIGIGNVCVDLANRHKGLGALLMDNANAYIEKSKSCGIILCHGEMVEFYSKYGWKKMECNKALVAGDYFSYIVMYYDPDILFPNRITSISLDRSF